MSYSWLIRSHDAPYFSGFTWHRPRSCFLSWLAHIAYVLWKKTRSGWNTMACLLSCTTVQYSTRKQRVWVEWTSGDLECIIFGVYITAYWQQCRAKKGGWFSSITPLIMRQHGSGCAAMATVLHWPSDGLPCVSCNSFWTDVCVEDVYVRGRKTQTENESETVTKMDGQTQRETGVKMAH